MLLIIISYIIIWPATKISHVFEVMEGLKKRGKTKRKPTSMLVDFFSIEIIFWSRKFGINHYSNPDVV